MKATTSAPQTTLQTHVRADASSTFKPKANSTDYARSLTMVLTVAAAVAVVAALAVCCCRVFADAAAVDSLVAAAVAAAVATSAVFCSRGCDCVCSLSSYL